MVRAYEFRPLQVSRHPQKLHRAWTSWQLHHSVVTSERTCSLLSRPEPLVR